jgi:hypothetical protein
LSSQAAVPASGAYGRRIVSVLSPASLAVFDAEHWPSLEVSFASAPTPSPGDIVMERGPGGRVCLDPSGSHVVVPLIAGAPIDELVHPGLTAAAWLAARLRGDEVMHAGACVHAGRAWVVIGDHEHGKSTLLALLLGLGIEILADDMVVIREGRACAGPRCLDLRPEAGRLLDMGVPVRGGFKRRVSLPPIAAEYPLHGFVHLDWGERLVLERLRPSERIGRLLAHTGTPPRRDPTDMLRLSELPHYLLSRPREWASARPGAALVRELLDAETAVSGA